MIRARIDATVFYTILKMVSKVLDEVTLRFTEEGMRIRQLDMAEVAMVDAFIPVNWFQEYEVVPRTDDKGNTVGNVITIRISDAKILAKKPKKDTVLSLEYGLESGEGKVKLGLSGLMTMTMTIPVFGGDEKELPLPKVNLTQKLLTKPRLLLEFAKEACHLTDTVRLISKNSELLLLVKGEYSEMSKSLIYEDGEISDFSLKEDVNAAYDINRLLKLVEASAGFDSVMVEFDHDLPLKLTYTFVGIGNITSWDQKAQVVFYQAPRVDRDGDYTPPTPPQEEPAVELEKPAEAPAAPAPEAVNMAQVEVEAMKDEFIQLTCALECDDVDNSGSTMQARTQRINEIEEEARRLNLPLEQWEAEAEKVIEKAGTSSNPQEEPKVEVYVCENCGRDIEEGRGKRLEDGDTWLCDACLVCETCEKKPVEVVDPLAAFRNRWSKK